MLDHQSPDRINYIVPYSLHSNYKEMSEFVSVVRPAILRKLVVPYEKFKIVKYKATIDTRKRLAMYLDKLNNIHKSESGYSYLMKHHTDITTLSERYLKWMSETAQMNLLRVLGLNRQPDHNLRKHKIDMNRLEMQALIYGQSKKESLTDIADKLKATNKNYSL
jgi:DNA cross-link repair 1B protein